MLSSHRNVVQEGASAALRSCETTTTYSSPVGVDPQQLERRIAERYRDVGNELAENLHFSTGRGLPHIGLGEETPLR